MISVIVAVVVPNSVLHDNHALSIKFQEKVDWMVEAKSRTRRQSVTSFKEAEQKLRLLRVRMNDIDEDLRREYNNHEDNKFSFHSMFFMRLKFKKHM